MTVLIYDFFFSLSSQLSFCPPTQPNFKLFFFFGFCVSTRGPLSLERLRMQQISYLNGLLQLAVLKKSGCYAGGGCWDIWLLCKNWCTWTCGILSDVWKPTREVTGFYRNSESEKKRPNGKSVDMQTTQIEIMRLRMMNEEKSIQVQTE